MKKKTPNDPDVVLHEMYHYVALTPDGLYHIQNIVGTMIGQHHVHSEQGYVKWKEHIDKKYLLMERVESCPCGLEPGAGSGNSDEGTTCKFPV
jgi:hypothetical protein